MICLFLQHKYSWNFIVWTNDNICMSNFLYTIFMKIFQVNIFSWYFAFFSGSFFYGLKDLFTLLHISWQSCPWTLKLMTSQAVELMWILHWWFRGLWPWSGQIWFHCFYDQNWIFSENVVLYIAQPIHSWELCQKPPFTASQAVLWSLSGYSEPKVPFKVAQGQMG